MSNLTDKEILEALKEIDDPMTGKSLVENNMIKNVKVKDGDVSFLLEYKSATYPHKEKVKENAEAAVTKLTGVDSVTINTRVYDPLRVIPTQQGGPKPGAQAQAPPQPQKVLPNAKYTIAVASGKGGVGKTTVAVNLAVALSQRGAKVGLLDADIYGPNVPIMMGVHDRLGTRNNRIAPLSRYGVEMVSVGFIAQGDAAIIWRGPLVGRMIQQFLQDVDWSELDYLVIDMPPGTGDAQLTLTQTMALTGAIVVCTPQEVALSDARKGINMFKKVEVPVLGVVENMSYFIAPDTGKHYDIFGEGGGKRMAKDMKVPFLGSIPLQTEVRVGADAGKPIVVEDPDSPVSQAFASVANGLDQQLSKDKDDQGVLKRVFKIS